MKKKRRGARLFRVDVDLTGREPRDKLRAAQLQNTLDWAYGPPLQRGNPIIANKPRPSPGGGSAARIYSPSSLGCQVFYIRTW